LSAWNGYQKALASVVKERKEASRLYTELFDKRGLSTINDFYATHTIAGKSAPLVRRRNSALADSEELRHSKVDAANSAYGQVRHGWNRRNGERRKLLRYRAETLELDGAIGAALRSRRKHKQILADPSSTVAARTHSEKRLIFSNMAIAVWRADRAVLSARSQLIAKEMELEANQRRRGETISGWRGRMSRLKVERVRLARKLEMKIADAKSIYRAAEDLHGSPLRATLDVLVDNANYPVVTQAD
jgi:hypothetical protein